MENKTYLIGETAFKLKELSLDEADEVNKLVSFKDGSMTVGNDKSKRFLELVLEPVESKNVDIDFGKTKETIAVEVLRDFFTRRLKAGLELKDYFQNLRKELA